MTPRKMLSNRFLWKSNPDLRSHPHIPCPCPNAVNLKKLIVTWTKLDVAKDSVQLERLARLIL